MLRATEKPAETFLTPQREYVFLQSFMEVTHPLLLQGHENFEFPAK